MIEAFKKSDKALQENMIACNKPLMIRLNNYCTMHTPSIQISRSITQAFEKSLKCKDKLRLKRKVVNFI